MSINSFSFTTFDSYLTALEGMLNIAGYFPNDQEYVKNPQHNYVYRNRYNFKQSITNFRYQYGKLLLIAGLATSILSFGLGAYHVNQRDFYNRLSMRTLEYAAHGAFNMARSSIESRGWGTLTLAYDLYNKKLLTYHEALPQFDIQARAFTYIKLHLDKVISQFS